MITNGSINGLWLNANKTMNLESKIQAEYKFLYDNGFINEPMIDNSQLFSSFNCEDHKSGLIINFTVEKSVLSIAISTKYILETKKFNRFNKFFDFLYVLKLLYPEIDFTDLKKTAYSKAIEDNLSEIKRLFSEANVGETVKKINELEKEYSKMRFG